MHIPVLLQKSIELLSIQEGDVVVDGTFGGGGHTSEILKQYGNKVKLICVDLDEEAKLRFNNQFDPVHKSNVVFVNENFKNADVILEIAEENYVDKVLLDLGTSTFQLLEDSRGFSFNSDSPLLMTFSSEKKGNTFTAYEIVNTWEENSIADILFYYGEEKKSRKIAKAIIEARKVQPIKTALELADVITSVIPKKSKIHPATKTFQAIRIAVNNELETLLEALDNWYEKLKPKGRIAVITFHSLEDRIVKRWMFEKKNVGRVITKKPISPSEEELLINKRSRSAKLRVFEK